ncbi:MAG: stage III sporulation protein AF [Bacillota bacterium]
MLEAISDIVKNVAVIILLTTFLDMLLPNSNMHRFIKVVMGLFVMMAILNPIINLIIKEDHGLTAWQLSTTGEQKIDTVLAQGEKITNIQQQQALSEYQNRIEKQMEAMIELIPGAGDVKCSVEIESVNKSGAIGRIEMVKVEVNTSVQQGEVFVNPVEPVNIQIGQGKGGKKASASQGTHPAELEEKIFNVLINYYNLKKESIEIIFY